MFPDFSCVLLNAVTVSSVDIYVRLSFRSIFSCSAPFSPVGTLLAHKTDVRGGPSGPVGLRWGRGGMVVGCRWDGGRMPVDPNAILGHVSVSCPFLSACSVASAERLELFQLMLTLHSLKDPLHDLRDRDVIQRR